MSSSTRIAALVAAHVNRGDDWTEAVRKVARALEVSPAAVAHCVAVTRERLSDPYLESLV